MADQRTIVFEKDIEKEKSRQRVVRVTAQVFLYLFLIVMALIIGAVIMNSLRISRSNPVESLKNE